ncbi:Multidrug efflux pump subunit AcrB [Chitinophaga costaii]|uniref:Multidrug efflux pump subunit AcrB n=1 Tax=Chitinophaga costaii TaxID=1335309 RepID=A0A1C4DGR7_9BACT|nr:efflux RND transporter permease subunit [Chitinophaga costaii]PUZ24628.1 AcrB/AcrD/AcrF family protein [Chitinophaga costaii]SCC30569.1 Multidrug efflux pump subunit AcrB [Chitinophaga costaii]
MVKTALQRPITIVVLFAGLLLFAGLAFRTIPIDIFPKLNSPTIYVIEQYGGMSAKQMEGFFATRMQDQFLYVNGIKNIESKNIQGLTLLKLTFYENTDMAEASAQVALQVNRTAAFFPPGALPPQVVRFDASSLPVGELVFSSKTRPLKEIFDLAITRVRPLFATVPGMSAPPPFGSNARTVLINVDPGKLRSYNLSADEVVQAITQNNSITPSGNLRQDSTMYVTSINSLEEKVQQFEDIPVKSDGGRAVFVHNVATVSDGADITVDYALVNGKRSVYIPVVKTADASTWDVVQTLRQRIPDMKSLLPADVDVTYAFDQSIFVINAAKSLMTEGILGAILTGLMVLLFLRDWRSSVTVVVTIPVAIISSLLFLKWSGQTINMMTLSGLSLAIGILVDQATVTIENIHQHLEMGKEKRQAIYDACREITVPLLLILLCILAVFAPAFIMTGVPRAMFLPLSLSIGFAMIISFVAAQTLVPIVANWLLKADMFQQHAHAGLALDAGEVMEVNHHTLREQQHPENNGFFQRLKNGLIHLLTTGMPTRKLWVSLYAVLVLLAAGTCFWGIGKDLLPKTNNGQLQLRLREPDGTRLEVTEQATKGVLALIDSMVLHHVAISSAYVGLVPSNFGTSNLYIFNSGTHEAVIQLNLDEDYRVKTATLQEQLRKAIAARYPQLRISFEPIELTEKIMAQGASTPIEVRVAGKNMEDIASFSGKVLAQLQKVPFLRDVQIAQPLHVPVLNIRLDRQQLALMGVSPDMAAKSITAATSSSRYTNKNLWLDERSAYTYQTQVQVPEYQMNSPEELAAIPLVKGQTRPILSDVATLQVDTLPGEYDRNGPRRFVTISANIAGKDLGSATAAVEKAVKNAGIPPTGLVTEIKGMSSLLTETMNSLQNGLLAAIVVILLLMAANYQSFGLAITVLSTVPAVILGALLALLATGATLNLQSYMGIIMSTGVSVANAILIVTNAEKLRLEYKDPFKAAIVSAGIRLRPILMTSLAMIAGMIPMASGLGESGDMSAPLGRAVIGGLIASTLAALLIVPLVYGWVQQRTSFTSISLLPPEETAQAPLP